MQDDVIYAAVAFFSAFEKILKEGFRKSTSPKVISVLPSTGRTSLEGRLLTFSSGFNYSSRRKDSFPTYDFTTLEYSNLSSMCLPERLISRGYFSRFKSMMLGLRVHYDHLPEGSQTPYPSVYDTEASFIELDEAYNRLSELWNMWDMSFVNVDPGLKRMNNADLARIERGMEGYRFEPASRDHHVEPEEIVRLINVEAGRLRALGQFSDALHLLEGIRAVAFADSNPFRLSDAAKIQVAAALVGLGHWTAHFAKNGGYRKRYLDFAARFKDPFFTRIRLVSKGYDDLDSDAFVERYKMLKEGVTTQITTYEFLGPPEYYEISKYYVRRGAHPDVALSELDGMTPDQVMRQATEINLTNGDIENALTEMDQAIQGYMQFDDLDKAVARLQEADDLVPNRDSFPYQNALSLRLKGDLLWRIGQKTHQQSDYRAGNSAWKESHRLFTLMNLEQFVRDVELRIV
ncbi:hypothetical protein [Rhizobium sp. LEGMi135b]